MKVCGPQGWEFDLQWRPKGGEIDIWKPENVKFPVGCPAPPSWGKPLIGALNHPQCTSNLLNYCFWLIFNSITTLMPKLQWLSCTIKIPIKDVFTNFIAQNALACEQAICVGQEWKNSEEREGGFTLSPNREPVNRLEMHWTWQRSSQQHSVKKFSGQ